MSERSLSPSDYYELKHVKSINYKHASNVKKGRTILYQSTDKLESDLNKCNLSCDCSECGQLVGFSLKLYRELPLKETRNQKKKKTLRRFKAVGNAIIFILTYKMEAIKRLKKKMHLLRAVRNLTVRRPAVVQSVHLLPVQQPIKQPQRLLYSRINSKLNQNTKQFIKTIYLCNTLYQLVVMKKSKRQCLFIHFNLSKKDQEKVRYLYIWKKCQKMYRYLKFQIQSFKYSQITKFSEFLLFWRVNKLYLRCKLKSKQAKQVFIFYNQLQLSILPKKEVGLKPLSILNDALSKNKKKRHIKCQSQLSLTQFNCQSQIKPFGELNKTQATNFYQNNNKDILKLIDIMKVKHRVIRVKK